MSVNNMSSGQCEMTINMSSEQMCNGYYDYEQWTIVKVCINMSSGQCERTINMSSGQM